MLNNVLNSVLDTVVASVRKHAPEILVGIGITGVVTGTVIACKETQNVSPILEEHQEQMNEIHKAFDAGFVTDEETKETAEYTPADMRRDTAHTYFRTAYKMCKLYLPAGLVIGGSIVCILSSHTIMTRRNVGLTAAYAGLSETYNNYRKNIIDKFGEAADVEARYNVKAKKTKGKDGEEPSVQYSRTDKTEESDHSRFFDQESRLWDKNVNMNLMALNSAKQCLNRKLKTRRSHVVTLNEVYDALDLRPSEDGQVLGYRFRPGVDKDKIDENGIPQIIDFLIIRINDIDGKVKKSVSDVTSTGEVNEPVMLLDFPGVEQII